MSAAGECVACGVAFVGVGLPGAEDGGGEEPDALGAVVWEVPAAAGFDAWFGAEGVVVGGACGVEVLALGGEAVED